MYILNVFIEMRQEKAYNILMLYMPILGQQLPIDAFKKSYIFCGYMSQVPQHLTIFVENNFIIFPDDEIFVFILRHLLVKPINSYLGRHKICSAKGGNHTVQSFI